jgi:hypothetical protein
LFRALACEYCSGRIPVGQMDGNGRGRYRDYKTDNFSESRAKPLLVPLGSKGVDRFEEQPYVENLQNPDG